MNVKQAVPLPPGVTGELKTGYSTHWAEASWAETKSSEAAVKNTSAKSMLEVVIDCFTEIELPFVQVNDQSVLEIEFRDSEYGKWTCYAKVLEEKDIFLFYSICPAKAPTERRSQVAEFITRANYDLLVGNFELNFETGGIRYKTSIDTERNGLTSPLVEQVTLTNLMMMDQYLPGILAVIENSMSPVEAIAQVECRVSED